MVRSSTHPVLNNYYYNKGGYSAGPPTQSHPKRKNDKSLRGRGDFHELASGTNFRSRAAPKTRARPQPLGRTPPPKIDDSSASSCTIQRFFFTRWIEASLLYSKVAPADLVEDALKAAPPCSKVALADSVENPLETSPLCSKVCMAE